MNAVLAVLVPVCNGAKFLRECLDSILRQDFRDFLLFVCDDGSTDQTPAILREYAARDARIHILTNPRNMGIAATRNRLLEAIPENAAFAAWIDADDVMRPGRLTRQIEFLNTHPAIGGVASSLEIIDENSRTTGSRHYPEDAGEIRRQLPLHNVLAQPAMMLRTELIRRVGSYSLSCPVCQDYDYWLRCLEYSDFANLKEPVLRYRISTTQAKQTKLKLSLRLTLKIQRDYYRRNRLRMPFQAVLRQAAGYMLLLLPSGWILTLFKFITYRTAKK